jgi:5-oxopent-3-ene-1,2,5-tricarboxylate decarboxylase/2-hydroxyhepta-2,4-diene-1,7-dioate isomerase
MRARVAYSEVSVWLPPFEVGGCRLSTIIALGLNYADHAKELAFNAQEEPLVFLKGPGTLVGHRGVTRRPPTSSSCITNASWPWSSGDRRNTWRGCRDAHVAGYCIANDYAVRDYLENWYRPNLRVKNRDGGTVLGSLVRRRGDVADPAQLGLRTFVNGKLTQQGNTRDSFSTSLT